MRNFYSFIEDVANCIEKHENAKKSGVAVKSVKVRKGKNKGSVSTEQGKEEKDKKANKVSKRKNNSETGTQNDI